MMHWCSGHGNWLMRSLVFLLDPQHEKYLCRTYNVCCGVVAYDSVLCVFASRHRFQMLLGVVEYEAIIY